MAMQDNCLFCQIARGDKGCHQVWENEDYLAFLSIYPNCQGTTVVITKEHYPSYAFDVPDQVLHGLIAASKKVGKLLDAELKDVGRTGLVLEGYGINHLHAKLFPLHGTSGQWQKRESDIDTYFKQYPGYISSHDSKRADDKELEELAARLRARNETLKEE